MDEFILNKTKLSDLIPLFEGEHKCESSHRYGPFVYSAILNELIACIY